MKLLFIHSDYIEYEVKEKAIPLPEEIKTTKDRLDEALTVFIAEIGRASCRERV
jgi:threonyl-tRNA synthetase